ncbi:MAG TPA: polysaccharide deacetylase family protein [Solirubrobacteraceae bacterium]|nr:polysaccharide deacetylase family protein [Solirubrobacteraceae bacterium]
MTASDHRSLTAAPLLGVLTMAPLVGYLLPGLAGVWPALRGPLGVEDRTPTRAGFALTFDDGPHAQGTPAMLELLAAAGVHATFFLVGEQVRRNPGLARELVAAGHQIGLHCDRHRNLLRLTPAQVRADIDRAEAAIIDSTDCAPVLYRPPYGVLNAAALRLARSRGWRTLLWTHWGRDWEARATAQSIAARVTDGVGEGSVLLLHDADDYSARDSWRRTAAALPRVLETLAERGLSDVRL